MGIVSYFSRDQREQRTFARHQKRVLRRTRAKDERMDESILFLAELGSEEALYVPLRRFDNTIKSESMDRFEKEMIHDILVEKGVNAIPPIIKFLGASENVTWPIQALRRITTEDQVVEQLVKVLAVENTKDTFKPDKKARLLELMADHRDPRVPPVAIGALKDFDETVRYGAVECLFVQGDEVAREPLLQLLTDENEESQRIKKRILEGLIEMGWSVKGFRKAVEELLHPHQWVDRQGTIKERGDHG